MDATEMQAIVLEQFGAGLVLKTVPRPVAGPGQVLVRVAASGVNPLDLKISAGAAAHAKVTPPAVLGIDLAGTIAAVGEGVEHYAVGDEVYGMTGGIGDVSGSLAYYAAVDADLIAHKPASLSMRQAAALPLVAITAWEGLVDRGQVGPSDVVLVHGGAGGVGHVAVQIALARGAKVYATGSGESLDVIRALGAEAIDYTTTCTEDYVQAATAGAGFDVVLDTVGGATLDSSFLAVRRYTGRVVSVLGWGSHNLAPLSFRGASYSGVFTLLPLLTGEGRAHHGEILTQIARLVDDGLITPRVDQTRYGLHDIAEAHNSVAVAANTGKVVVDLAPNSSL